MKNQIFEGFVNEVLRKYPEDFKFGKKAHTYETLRDRAIRRQAERTAKVIRGFYLKYPDLYEKYKARIKGA